MTQLRITDDLEALLDVLPADIRHAVEKADDSENLLEIILDLGRVPTRVLWIAKLFCASAK